MMDIGSDSNGCVDRNAVDEQGSCTFVAVVIELPVVVVVAVVAFDRRQDTVGRCWARTVLVAWGVNRIWSALAAVLDIAY